MDILDVDSMVRAMPDTLLCCWEPSDHSPPQEAWVLFDAPAELVLGGPQQGTEYAMSYDATRLCGLDTGETVWIAGQAYRVRQVQPVDDGRMTRTTLTRVRD